MRGDRIFDMSFGSDWRRLWVWDARIGETFGAAGGLRGELRFLFKVRFLPMTANQIAEAYRRTFRAEAPAFVLKLSALTPADFATVATKASALAERDPRILAQWLEHEAQAKPGAERRKIGF